MEFIEMLKVDEKFLYWRCNDLSLTCHLYQVDCAEKRPYQNT